MKIQQTVFLILFSFSMPALLAVMGGCDRLATDSGTTASGLRINASISQAVNGEILDFVRLTVSGRDMTTINETFPILEGRYFEATVDVSTGERRFELTVETIDSLVFTDLGVDTVSHAVYRGDVTTTVRPVSDFEIDIPLEPVVPLIKLVSRYIEVSSGGEFSIDLVVKNLTNLTQIGVLVDFGYFIESGVYPVPVSFEKSPTLSQSVIVSASLVNDDTQYEILLVDPSPLVDASGDATLGTITFQVPHAASLTPLELVPLTLEIFRTIPQRTDIFLDRSHVRIIPIADSVVTFPDADLVTAVRTNLGIPTGDIMLSDLLGTDFFYWQDDGTQIADLTNFDLMQNLTGVSLAYQSFTDLTPIGELVNLTDIEITGMSLGSIAPLANNHLLQFLILDYDELKDITPLQDLTGLQFVNLGNNQISDIAALENLPNLQNLDLSNNLITNILPLVNNPGIGAGDAVNLSGNQLDSLSVTNYLSDLQERGVVVTYP